MVVEYSGSEDGGCGCFSAAIVGLVAILLGVAVRRSAPGARRR